MFLLHRYECRNGGPNCLVIRGTLVVITVLLLGYLLISKFSSERAIDQKITDSFLE